MTTIRVTVHIPPMFVNPPRAAVRQSVGRGLTEITETIADLARTNAPGGARGLLRANIRTEVQDSGASIVGMVFTTKDVPYARYVEEGTAPHWAPIAPLKLWARRVLGSERLAYVVQRAIARRGTRAQRFFGNAVDATRPRIRVILDQNLAEGLRAYRGGP